MSQEAIASACLMLAAQIRSMSRDSAVVSISGATVLRHKLVTQRAGAL
jgi:hypothetical protein